MHEESHWAELADPIGADRGLIENAFLLSVEGEAITAGLTGILVACFAREDALLLADSQLLPIDGNGVELEACHAFQGLIFSASQSSF